jgi:transposase-like protein
METYLMEVVCCKCGIFYGVKEVNKNPRGMVSHGVCPACKYQWEKELEQEAIELDLVEKGGAIK